MDLVSFLLKHDLQLFTFEHEILCWNAGMQMEACCCEVFNFLTTHCSGTPLYVVRSTALGAIKQVQP